MRLEEAINWNKRILKIPRIQEQLCDEYNDAIRLGIEALKKVKAVREGKEWVGINLLPGETEEQ